MEADITTIGTILMGAFYVVGYLLNHHSKKKSDFGLPPDSLGDGQTEFITTLSSTASQSTTLNIQLWQKVTELEEQQVDNQAQLALLQSQNCASSDSYGHIKSIREMFWGRWYYWIF